MCNNINITCIVVGANWKLSRFNHIISHARASVRRGDVNFLYLVPRDGVGGCSYLPLAVMRESEKNSSPGTRSRVIYYYYTRIYVYIHIWYGCGTFFNFFRGSECGFQACNDVTAGVGHNAGRKKKGKLRVVSSVRGVPGPEPFVFENRRSATVGIGRHVTILLLLLLPRVRSPSTPSSLPSPHIVRSCIRCIRACNNDVVWKRRRTCSGLLNIMKYKKKKRSEKL